MAFELTILGSNSAIPAHGRHPTSQILNVNDRLFMIDCGEATQIQLMRYKIRFNKIDHIFISHLHGDHYFGLIGLITSYSLNQRTNPLHVFGPEGLEEIIHTMLRHSDTQLGYPLLFHAFAPENGKVVFEDAGLRVESLVMKHRISCSGFVFREKQRELNIVKEKIDEYQLTIDDILAIKQGQDLLLADGRLIPKSELVAPKPHLRSYAFCSDTLYNEDILPFIQEVDLLYHDTTFDHGKLDRAVETFHSTTIQSGTLAVKANAKQLLIGHFSSRYTDLNILLDETHTVFANAHLATEGEVFGVERG
jgi:ribonuclease Z